MSDGFSIMHIVVQVLPHAPTLVAQQGTSSCWKGHGRNGPQSRMVCIAFRYLRTDRLPLLRILDLEIHTVTIGLAGYRVKGARSHSH